MGGHDEGGGARARRGEVTGGPVAPSRCGLECLRPRMKCCARRARSVASRLLALAWAPCHNPRARIRGRGRGTREGSIRLRSHRRRSGREMGNRLPTALMTGLLGWLLVPWIGAIKSAMAFRGFSDDRDSRADRRPSNERPHRWQGAPRSGPIRNAGSACGGWTAGAREREGDRGARRTAQQE